MMDPATVLGVAAASSQVGEQVIKLIISAVKLCSELKDASEFVRKQLFHIEQLTGIAKLIIDNPALQISSLESVLRTCLEAIREIESELRTTKLSNHDSKGEKWSKALLICLKKKEITGKFSRLEREKSSLILCIQEIDSRVLLKINIEVESIHQGLDKVSFEIRDTKLGISTVVDALPDLQAALSDTDRKVTTIYHEVPKISDILASIHEQQLPELMRLLGVHGKIPAQPYHDFDFGLNLGRAPQIDDESFVGREIQLEQLRDWLLPKPGSQRTVAISGLGGMGKTQLSVRFAKQFQSNFKSIFWLNAKTESLLREDLLLLSKTVLAVVPSQTASNEEAEKIIEQVHGWLSLPNNNEWLIIYDNYDDPNIPGQKSSTGYDIRQYFPKRIQGSLLITTRSRRLTFAKQLRLQKLDDVNQSLAIIAHCSGREVNGDENALKLALRLDGLPLALTTAGMYLRQSPDTFEEYLNQYEESWEDLGENSNELLEYEDRTLYSTWNLSLKAVESQDIESGKLLRFMAYLDNTDIWYQLLRGGVESGPVWFHNVIKSKARFNKAMAVLDAYSLLEIQLGFYSIHTCVQDWILEVLNRDLDLELYKLAVQCIVKNIPSDQELGYWVLGRRLLQHTTRLNHPRLVSLNDEITFEDSFGLGLLYQQQGKIEEAEKMYLRALTGYEKAWGPDHTSTLSTVNNLGLLYSDQGKMDEAEKMYLRALTGYEKAWGPDHTSTLGTVNNLGNLYRSQGKMDEAEKMYLRALTGYKKAWGPDHTSTLNTVNNLGNLYTSQGKMDEAEKMYLRALTGYEKAWGPDHTSTLSTVNNLGLLYSNQGKMDEAEKMYLRALTGYEKAWGPDHTSTLGTVNNLGNLYRSQGKMDEAEKMYLRALTGCEKAWGPDHTSTFDTVNNLGLLYSNQGKMDEAEKMYLRALTGYEKAWGPDHTSTLNTVNNLGNLYTSQGKMDEAEKMYLRALTGYEKALGPEHYIHHLHALTIMENYGNLLADIGSQDQGEKLLAQALSGLTEIFGQSSQRCQQIIARLNTLRGSIERQNDSK